MVLGKQIACVTACYFGRRDNNHPAYQQDPLFYLKTHLKYLPKSIDKIYFICTGQTKKNLKILDNLDKSEFNREFEILTKENYGGSYTGWEYVLNKIYKDFDLTILIEDDYIIKSNEEKLVEYFIEEPNLFYLCQLWSNSPYRIGNQIIEGHAAISNGVINNLLYKEAKEKNIHFKLNYAENSNKLIMFENQATFLEDYKEKDYLIKDITEKYSSPFNSDSIKVMEYGNHLGDKIFLPITQKYITDENN